MTASQKGPDFFSQWGDFQKNFFSHWTEAYGKIYHPWMDSMKFWQGLKPPFAGSDVFSKWTEMMSETIGKAADQADGGIGPTVLLRMMRAGNVFVVLNEFWMEILKDLPALYQVKGDDVQSREIFDRWAAAYKKVFEQLFGTPISGTAEEIMKSWLNIAQMQQAILGMWWNPWIHAAPQLQEQVEKFMKGDWSALTAGRSLWREVYDETLGRVFRMPAFGLTKEQSEKFRRAYDAFIQFWLSLPHFYQLFYDTGMVALQEMFDKIRNLKHDKFTPDTAREIYKLWIVTNEDTFFQLFKKPEFSNAMGEVLKLGLQLKMRLDELNADICEALSIPSNRDFDAVAKAVQELRRTVRRQQKTIEALQQQINKS
jgi:hypothetical protein